MALAFAEADGTHSLPQLSIAKGSSYACIISLLVVGKAAITASGGGGRPITLLEVQVEACIVVIGAFTDKPFAKMDRKHMRDELNSPFTANGSRLGDAAIARKYASASA